MSTKNNTTKKQIGPLHVWIVGHPQNPLVYRDDATGHFAMFYKRKDAVAFKRAHKGTFYQVMKAVVLRGDWTDSAQRDPAYIDGQVKSLEHQLEQEREEHRKTAQELYEVTARYETMAAARLNEKASELDSPVLTPRAKAAIALAHKEAVQGGQSYVGTEHLLLGMLRQGEGVAKRHFLACGMTYDKAEYAMRVGRVS